jgi:hypothetical protein
VTEEYPLPAELAVSAAARIDGHVQALRSQWPALLGHMRAAAGRARDNPAVPAWCWLPMTTTAALISGSGSRPSVLAHLSRLAAVGQWRLTGRRIVIPSPQVATDAIPRMRPRRLGDDDPIAGMDLQLPVSQLLEDLAGACYYLVMPVRLPDEGGRSMARGCYVHLEHDPRPGNGPELRLLIDYGGELLPRPVRLDQPTLAWSDAALAAEDRGAGVPPDLLTAATGLARTAAWEVWPLIASLLTRDTILTRTMVLDGPGVGVNVRGAEVWQITYVHPPATLTPVP